MSLFGLLSRMRWGLTPNHPHRGKPGRQRRRCRPLLEQLETRVVPTTLNSVFELDGNAVQGTLHSAPIPTGSSTTTSHDWNQVYTDFLNGNTALSGAQVISFVTDMPKSDPNSSSFTQGSKDIDDVSAWHYQQPESSQDKDDILHAFVASYLQDTDDPGTDPDLLIYFGADRFAQNGDAKIGFWFFQNPVSLGPNGTFVGTHAVGDILVESNFTQGGGVATVQVYRWVGSGGSDGTLDLLLPPNSPDTFAIVNDSPQSSP